MGYVIEIAESKVDKMSEYVEDMLWAGGELMHCLEKMKGEHEGYGERDGYRGGRQGGSSYGSRYGMRSRYDNYGQREDYGMRGGYRDDEWEMEDEMGERRRRSRRTGRYM